MEKTDEITEILVISILKLYPEGILGSILKNIFMTSVRNISIHEFQSVLEKMIHKGIVIVNANNPHNEALSNGDILYSLLPINNS